jgi:PqqD family protein of HPr-rel-A system
MPLSPTSPSSSSRTSKTSELAESAPKQAWELNPLVKLSWRRWADDWVVFDAASGYTHQMDALAAIALMCFEAGPSDLASLSERVAGELDLPSAENVSRSLEERVERLAKLGLIEPLAP